MELHCDPSKFPAFGKLDGDFIIAEREKLLKTYEHVAKDTGVNWDEVQINEQHVIRLIDIVERRRVYFHVFHSGMEMGELNEASLVCFWMLKLHLFHVKNEDSEYSVNLLLALNVFIRALRLTAEKLNGSLNLTNSVLKHMMHTFNYRDLSKEALMLLAISLVGIDYEK